MNFFLALSALALGIHLLWILWVIFGAIWTARRPRLALFHAASLVWGVLIEAGPWPCPLTLAEQWSQRRAGIEPYREPFLVHYLEKIVYPDVPPWLLVTAALAVAAVNGGVYLRRIRESVRRGDSPGARLRPG